MTPAFAASIGELADAAIARVHGEVPTDRDDAILVKVLAFAKNARDLMQKAADGIGSTLQKMADLGCDPTCAQSASDLRKCANGLTETVARLQEVADEPKRRFVEPFTGVPVHLTNRALTFTTRTLGSA